MTGTKHNLIGQKVAETQCRNLMGRQAEKAGILNSRQEVINCDLEKRHQKDLEPDNHRSLKLFPRPFDPLRYHRFMVIVALDSPTATMAPRYRWSDPQGHLTITKIIKKEILHWKDGLYPTQHKPKLAIFMVEQPRRKALTACR
ncbi:hypothetical protein B0H17DRAFT_1136699 [Mycena rosella]|uniref:Uncharacterized protein n=1 Tax=Mycena rosella TaxID=1033263 RepID=A0AAD7DAF4_MYCRO|nr:hypothetical protein B0H17DRAFT_1136699 [Mycena rosella]